ncbi:hypothetical protein [Natronococcus occultus]|uniref:DUF8107 domain-containing protein n=1 Tax=Natronococcus occultus SP4 TaxID=694430 RepID=L0K0U2_9EURY|nr:hypothetical protein [Natronococcus occultus]AGB37738.1 hypothetical protein Natoc_1948 [Natronococcus occultus SP4]
MADPDADPEGFREGLESSRGDPRVLLVLNAVLSLLFGWMIVAGAAVVGLVEVSFTTVVAAAAVLFVLALVMTRP